MPYPLNGAHSIMGSLALSLYLPRFELHLPALLRSLKPRALHVLPSAYALSAALPLCHSPALTRLTLENEGGFWSSDSRATVIKCVRLQLQHALLCPALACTILPPPHQTLLHPYHVWPLQEASQQSRQLLQQFGCFGTQTAGATFVCLPSIFTLFRTHTDTARTHTHRHCSYTHSHALSKQTLIFIAYIWKIIWTLLLFFFLLFLNAFLLVSIAYFRRTRWTRSCCVSRF